MSVPFHIAAEELRDYGFFASTSTGDDDRAVVSIPGMDVLLAPNQLHGLADALRSLANSLEASKAAGVTQNGLPRQPNGAQ